MASRGVRLGAAPDAPLRGRCSSETHSPAGRAVEPWEWFSAHIAEHWAVPVTTRNPVQRSEQNRLEETDRANLPDHLAALGFSYRACDLVLCIGRQAPPGVVRKDGFDITGTAERDRAPRPLSHSTTGFAGRMGGRSPFPWKDAL